MIKNKHLRQIYQVKSNMKTKKPVPPTTSIFLFKNCEVLSILKHLNKDLLNNPYHVLNPYIAKNHYDESIKLVINSKSFHRFPL